MKRSHKNKEIKPTSKNKPISSYYGVSKRLFDPNKSDNTSPAFNSSQSSSPALGPDDSPYTYEISRKGFARKISIQRASTPLNSAINETPLKRSASSGKPIRSLCSYIVDFSNGIQIPSPGSSSTISEMEEDCDLNKENPCPESYFLTDEMEEALGDEAAFLSRDYSQECTLNVIRGKHPELSTIAAETYAINLFCKEDVEKYFFNLAVTSKQEKSAKLLLFYCEFSSERAPNMMRFIRNRDRHLNPDTYPFVYYPEMYLIDGGYKSFFANFKELCEPQNYKPMLAEENAAEYVRYKCMCKSYFQKLQKDSENR